ncbi:MAG TPA: alpha/beta hydrolase [Spirochaetota bacterium]|nr:alpha/beta hydrolase [Spirochaetota bacterium]
MKQRKITIRYNNGDYNLSIRYRKNGGELVFFIHGLGCSQNNFNDAWHAEGLSRHSLVSLDLPGFGESSMADNFSCDMNAYAEICSDVLSLFPEFRVHLVGHSMGGAIGILLTDMIHDRLVSFVNIEGNLIGRDCSASREKASVSFDDFKTKQLPALILTTSLSVEPGRRMWSQYLKMADKKGLYLSSRSLVRWSDSGLLLKKFKELDCKKVYIYGEANSFLNVLTFLNGIQTVPISNSGHFPMNDNSEEFYNFLSDFYQ